MFEYAPSYVHVLAFKNGLLLLDLVSSLSPGLSRKIYHRPGGGWSPGTGSVGSHRGKPPLKIIFITLFLIFKHQNFEIGFLRGNV